MQRSLATGTFFSLFALFGGALATAGCSNDIALDTVPNPPRVLESICDLANAPAGCGQTCERDGDCTMGTFCSTDTCNAFCTPGGGECGVDSMCTDRGRCEDILPDGGVIDTECQDLQVPTARRIPEIVVIVDRSGSMEADFEGDCQYMTPPNTACAMSGTPNPEFGDQRWAAAREALVGNDGLIRRLGSIVRFSFAAYDKPPGAMCPPALESVPAALDNANNIATVYNAIEPRGGWTPTAEAIDAITAQQSPSPDRDVTFLLATDGFPNGCEEVVGDAADLAASVAAVRRAHATGIDTYVLGVSFEDGHLGDLANAGLGVQSGAEWWSARNASQLEAALLEIIDLQIPCEVELGGTIRTVRACQGSVSLGGDQLSCNDETRGWRALDGNTIELLGSACDEWRSGLAGELRAQFPCGVVVQ